MCWPVICIAELQAVLIRLISGVNKAGQMVRSGTSNKSESIGNRLVKFNLSLHRPRIFKNIKIYLQLNTNTKVKEY